MCIWSTHSKQKSLQRVGRRFVIKGPILVLGNFLHISNPMNFSFESTSRGRLLKVLYWLQRRLKHFVANWLCAKRAFREIEHNMRTVPPTFAAKMIQLQNVTWNWSGIGACFKTQWKWKRWPHWSCSDGAESRDSVQQYYNNHRLFVSILKVNINTCQSKPTLGERGRTICVEAFFV